MSDGWRLYADMGNSTLQWAAHGPGGWSDSVQPAPGEQETPRDTALAVRTVLEAAGYALGECSGAALLSSNPRMTAHVEEALADLTGREVALLGRDIRSELPIAYCPDSSKMGQDRIAVVEGARALCGAPVAVLSCGTCLTAQALTTDGVIIAGGIGPGISACVTGLIAHAPHLAEAARVSEAGLNEAVHERLGLPSPCRDTTDNLVVGLAAAINGAAQVLAATILEEAETEGPVLLTGGWAPIVDALAEGEWRLEPLLTLEGLRAVHERALEE